MNIEIHVDNIKCGGCANTIRKELLRDDRITEVCVAVEAGSVCVTSDSDLRDEVVKRLAGLGYPEAGTVEGLGSAKAKAKSFVSCAIGRMSDKV